MSRYFTEDHEWIDLDGEVGTVGISDYAQSQLGDIVFVEVPEAGKRIAKAVKKLKLVDPQGEVAKAARAVGIVLGE